MTPTKSIIQKRLCYKTLSPCPPLPCTKTLLLVCAAARAKSLFPSSRVVHLNKKRIGMETQRQPADSERKHEPTTLFSRSALKGRNSNYLFSSSMRHYSPKDTAQGCPPKRRGFLPRLPAPLLIWTGTRKDMYIQERIKVTRK